ncbi:LysR family transcriptional regulator [Kiloniella sp. b19]|uniref:LysR family transcriptional regulator n=1 Tax=Kiloniella sp. GXU_MW_B19 TaxID=3141326 RepID=UPI0031E1C973
MELYSKKLLRTFCAVVEGGGFVGAQQLLGLSQPAISAHINMLEETLGYVLCQRGRSGFYLTERGRSAYEKCCQLLNIIEDYEAELIDLKEKLKGTLRIGLVDNVLTNSDFPLSEVIERFYADDNEVQLELKMAAPNELETDLLNNRIQLAIAPFSQRLEELDYVPLFAEEHRLYCGMKHPLFTVAEGEVEPSLVENYPMSSRTYWKSESGGSVELGESPALVSNMEAQAILILSGRFLGALPVHYARDWVRKGQMRELKHPDLVWASEFSLVSRKSVLKRYAASVFIDVFQDVMLERKGREA